MGAPRAGSSVSDHQIPPLQERLSSIDQKLIDRGNQGYKDSIQSNKGSSSSHQSNVAGSLANKIIPKSAMVAENLYSGVHIDPSTDSRVELNIEAKDLHSQNKFKRS